MAELMQINELAQNLNKYSYLKVWVTEEGLNVLNLNINKQLILYREPIYDAYGCIENKNTGDTLLIRKPLFNYALSHLYRIANEITTKK